MAPLRLTPSNIFTIATGLVVAAIVGALAFTYVGWLGLGIIGLFGLVGSVREELSGGKAPGTAGILARQARGASEDDSPEARMRAAASWSKRSGILYLVNTVCIALVAVGFGMFFLHQF